MGQTLPVEDLRKREECCKRILLTQPRSPERHDAVNAGACKLGISRTAMQRLFKRWNEQGIDGLSYSERRYSRTSAPSGSSS